MILSIFGAVSRLSFSSGTLLWLKYPCNVHGNIHAEKNIH